MKPAPTARFDPAPAARRVLASGLGTSLCLLAGCLATDYHSLHTTPYALRIPADYVAPLELEATNTVSMTAAIAHAWASDPRVNAHAARYYEADADLAGIQPDAPEIRVGYESGRSKRRGWSTQEEWSRGDTTGREVTRDEASQRTESVQTSRTNFGDPFDPDQTSVENTETRETSRGEEVERSRSTSTSRETTGTADSDRRYEDGFSVSLRLRPPNPWELGAARAAGHAARTVSEAELLHEERILACDIVESAIKLLYHVRMAAVQSAFADRVAACHARSRHAFAAGAMNANDYADAIRLAAMAQADRQRLLFERATREAELRRLSGLDPNRLELPPLAAMPITPFSLPSDPAGDPALAASLTAEHPGLLAAAWRAQQLKAEYEETTARRLPWPTHLAGGYAWWEGRNYGSRQFDRLGFEQQTSTASSHQTETESIHRTGTETESPSGDVTEREETGRRSTTGRSYSRESEFETTTGGGYESSYESSKSDEWWVEVGVEIPIFDWLSGEGRLRGRAAAAARQTGEHRVRRTRHEIQTALQAARANRQGLERARRRFLEGVPELKPLAASARQGGAAGEIAALHIESDMLDMLLGLLDCAMREQLSRLDLVRAAGLLPALETSELTERNATP